MALSRPNKPQRNDEVLCASVAVAVNKSSLVRVGGWGVLIALLIWNFAPRQHLINTSRRPSRRPIEPEGLSFHLIVSESRKKTLLRGGWPPVEVFRPVGKMGLDLNNATRFVFHASSTSVEREQQSRDPALRFN